MIQSNGAVTNRGFDVITIIGGNKGGSAKTTTAINIAVGLALQGKKICLVDADIQRSASRWHEEREKAKLTPVIILIEENNNISQAIKKLDQEFDHVIVDVAGRNSKELITGGAVAHQIVAPHQCSQLDLDTMLELEQQLIRLRELNPELKAFCYQSMATTNHVLRDNERREFLEFVSEFNSFSPLKAISCYRKVYRDVMSEGKSVLETANATAKAEVLALLDEVF